MPRTAFAFLLISTFVASFSAAQESARNQKNAGVAASRCGDKPYCAETGRQIKQETPVVPPRANQVFRDPDFGSRIVRVTDENGINGNFPGFSFGANSSGEISEWGKFNPSLGPNGGYFFYVMTGGGGAVPFSMDATTMQVAARCGSLPRCRLPSGGSFSYVDPNVIYGHFGSRTSIEAYNVATGKQSTIYDLTKCPGLPADISGYPGSISNSGDDMKFSDYPGGKMQGYGTLVIFYDRSAGRCYWYDTAAGTTGGTGMTSASVNAGNLMPPAEPQLRATDGNLPPGDYYVRVSANTRMNPTPGETLASPEAHIRLSARGGIEVRTPALDNRYKMALSGYTVYVGTAPGKEERQGSVNTPQGEYVQSAELVKGSAPPKSSTAGYNVHNARLSRDGKVVKVTGQQGGAIYFWIPGTTTVSACSSIGAGGNGVADHCGGHTAMGYTHLINHGGSGGDTSLLLRRLDDLNQYTQLMPGDVPASMDAHLSWNNADSADASPICGSFSRSSFKLMGDGSRNPATNPLLGIRQPWDREIVCIATSGPPTVWRFAHHHATGACNASAKDGSCFGAIAIGNVSQDGKFFLFNSDWDWSLGGDSHSPGCPATGRCRTDTFIVELK